MEQELAAKLLGSFTLFLKTFYKIRTGRDFVLAEGISRPCFHIEIAKILTSIVRGKNEKKNLLINVPPRYGKTEMLIHFVAWSLAKYPDSNYMYISFSHSLAKKQTKTIREIVNLPQYKKLFGVEIKEDSNALDNFETTSGGSVYAVGAAGTITGRGAGIQNCDRFGGALIIDDIHKPLEVTSDVMRQAVLDWYDNTLLSRLNNPQKTPIIFLGQRLHEDDLAAKMIKDESFEKIIFPALDVHDNPLNINMHTKETLLKMSKEAPYDFAAQYQQDPQPAGGGLFSKDDFALLDYEPNYLTSFITIDTAETDKDWNDKTVFSFFGVYEIPDTIGTRKIYGLHWINCEQLSIEPKDLENEFNQFVVECSRMCKEPPSLAAIEKKSTGVTLVSILKEKRGISILDINRTKASGSKSSRYLEMQPYIKKKLISLPQNGNHTKFCLEHMSKITANDSHRWDDICDTLYDAIKLALIDKTIYTYIPANQQKTSDAVKSILSHSQYIKHLRNKAYANR